MAITTYAELQTAVADFLNRDDLTAIIPDFITLAEAQMQRKLRHYQMEKRATSTVNERYSALPADFLQPIRLHIDGQNKALDAISSLAIQDDRFYSVSGEPRYYSITAGEIELLPTPDGDYTLELYYYRTLPVLSASNTTNWLLTAAPDAYLYGALLQSAPYLQEDSRIPVWGALYAGAIEDLNRDSDRAKWGGSGLAIRKIR